MFNNFSSLPPHEEQAFIVYEQRTAEASSKAVTMGAVAGAIVLVLAIGVFLGVAPKEIDYSKDMNMSNLTKKNTPAAAAKSETAPAAAKPDSAPAEAPPKADTPAPAEAPKQ